MITNKTKNYKPRIVEAQIKEALNAFGAVLIRGPKWCGKTTISEYFANSAIYLDDDMKSEEYDLIAKNDPSRFLEGERPHLLDEWQLYPVIWDAVRRSVDRDEIGKSIYILTGSFSPKPGATKHTGSMRISSVDMETMTLFESEESSGEVSFLSLFEENEQIKGTSKITKDGLTRAMVRGGYPAGVLSAGQNASIYGKEALKSLISVEMSEALNEKTDEGITRTMLRSLARNISAPVRNGTIMEDMSEAGFPVAESTFYKYFDALKRLFVIREVPSWNPNIRSATSIRSSTKKIFNECALACAILNLGEGALSRDYKTRGLMFECLCGKELSVYAQKYGGTLNYYRDRYGLECDYVIHLEDGRYGLFECKCGEGFIEEGAKHLNRLERNILDHIEENPTTTLEKPACKVLITDATYALRREDGVIILPIACLRD